VKIVPLYPEITFSIIFFDVYQKISSCDEFSVNILSKEKILESYDSLWTIIVIDY